MVLDSIVTPTIPVSAIMSYFSNIVVSSITKAGYVIAIYAIYLNASVIKTVSLN